MTKKQVLICGLMPEVDRDSGSRRVFDLIELMSEAGWGVTFLSHHAKAKARYVRALEARGVAVYLGASAVMETLVKTGRFDLALFGLWHVAEPHLPVLRLHSPHTRIIVDSVDLHMLRNARRVFTQGANNGAAPFLDAEYASEMVRELNTFAAADAVLTVSQKEADLINDFLADSEKAYPVADCEDLPTSTVAYEKRRGMLFVGCYRHAPNADAVHYLCKEIVPRLDPKITAEHPVYIVGDGLNDELRRVGEGIPGVRMVGWVPSVLPYLESARMAIIPLRYGAGTKRKVLQALMTGTPTVSTSIGVEGFPVTAGEDVLVANDPASFAHSITRLLGDAELWRRLASLGRERVLTAHGRGTVRAQLLKVVEHVMQAAPAEGSRLTPVRVEVKEKIPAREYCELREAVRALVQRSVPAGASVLFVSRGDDALLNVPGLRGMHFPQGEKAEYAGYHPADSAQAIVGLEALRARGAEFLVIPATSVWWLDHYKEFAAHLDAAYTAVVQEHDTCIIYDLRKGVSPAVNGVAHHEIEVVEPEAPANPVRLIAFYLPQFHPIPENDRWWGKGFTEWTNVSKAQPLFPDHYQPHLPQDLGFYDLRMAQARAAQAELARQYGIHGFCYYHYWFGGKRLLEQPFNAVLQEGKPELPFCLCWANEPWSRRWNGRPEELLQEQNYSPEDDLEHIRWLMPVLADSRAIKIEGKPVFLVYQGRDLPDPARTIATWRKEVERAGLPGVYLMTVETGWDAGWDATEVGFDAKVLFQPQFTMLFNSGTRLPVSDKESLRVFDYEKAWPVLANPEPVPYRRYDTVFPSWDNTARTGHNGVVVHNATPKAYQEWLSLAITRAQCQDPEHRILFINAWNEWAEGCHLEPDLKNGRAYLEATAAALRATAGAPPIR